MTIILSKEKYRRMIKTSVVFLLIITDLQRKWLFCPKYVKNIKVCNGQSFLVFSILIVNDLNQKKNLLNGSQTAVFHFYSTVVNDYQHRFLV